MERILSVLNVLIFIIIFSDLEQEVAGSYCYSYDYNFYHYCNGYCSYVYNTCEETGYIGSLTIGEFVGIIIGCIVFILLIVSVIVIVCCVCMKSAGHHGRVVSPTHGTINTIQPPQVHTNNYFNYITPSAPPFESRIVTQQSYPLEPIRTSGVVPLPPIHAPAGHPPPPPSYSAFD